MDIQIATHEDNLKAIGIDSLSDETLGKKGFTGSLKNLSTLGRIAALKSMGKNQNPIVPGAADFVQWNVWDRMTYAAATQLPNLISYFSIPQNTQGKTKMDTNLTQSQTFPAPNWLNAVGIGMYFGTNMQKPDIDILLNNYWLEFWCQEKVYLEGHLWMFPSPGGLTAGFNQAAAAAQITAYNNGVPQTYNVFDVRLPAGMDLGGITTDGTTGIIINGGQTFHVDLKTTAAASTITLAAASGVYGGYLCTIVLQGTYSRAVQ